MAEYLRPDSNTEPLQNYSSYLFVPSAALCLCAKPALGERCSPPEFSRPPRTLKILNIITTILHQTPQNQCHKSDTFLRAWRGIWRENLYCVTPLLSTEIRKQECRTQFSLNCPQNYKAWVEIKDLKIRRKSSIAETPYKWACWNKTVFATYLLSAWKKKKRKEVKTPTIFII